MKTPSADDLHIAAQWLDVYEGAEDAEACQRVRVWLLKKADEAEMRESCKQAGVKVSDLKMALRKQS